jgi:enamine deaminase RidA (YjgF/YER057c/UK114 family)
VNRRIVNPWTWQDRFGFVQANELTDMRRVLICAGQASFGSEGNPIYAGDMQAQINQSLDNLQTVLDGAGLQMSDVVRLNYTTDVDAFVGAAEVLGGRLAGSGCHPASTLLGVQRLAFPDLLIEIEATAVA